MNIYNILGVLLLLLTSCGQPNQKNNGAKTASSTEEAKLFTMSQIPAIYNSEEEQINYLALHYWSNFNFRDTTFISKADVTEKAFANFIHTLTCATKPIIDEALNKMMDSALTEKLMYSHFITLSEKYLHDPNSPFRNGAQYITILNHIITSDIDETLKIRPRYQLEMTLKNCPGDIASDFIYILPNSSSAKMSDIEADYIILFFNNPDCEECKRIKELLSQISVPKIRIVAMYVDDDIELWRNTKYPQEWINGYSKEIDNLKLYDLCAIPSLYLLDKDKRVILKDAPIDNIIEYFD